LAVAQNDDLLFGVLVGEAIDEVDFGADGPLAAGGAASMVRTINEVLPDRSAWRTTSQLHSGWTMTFMSG